MIIVSQDKKIIVNFNNITSLWIDNPLENDEGYFSIEATGELGETIGYYKTEERAKEVLQEIKEAYSIYQFFKCLANENIAEKKMEVQGKYKLFDVYEMPKE